LEMAGLIPDEFLEDLRSRTDIVEIISEYVTLKRTGQNYIGLCPFHQEKTPSFSVSPAKQIFYCFGCGVGGNVFSFLMKIDNISFLEAVEVIAERQGVDVPRSRNYRQKQERKSKIYELNAQAAAYYHRILLRDDAAQRARRYLLGRGVKEKSWERYTIQEIREAGLFFDRYGTLKERFQGRIIFPIFDHRGRCLGFGGRSLGDEQPKYLNSPESVIFNKSRNLYGLHLALPAIRKEQRVIVVEGYMDCITVQEYGFQNTVASLGTAFTQEQSRLLLRCTKEVVLAFDQDSAGSAATLRGASLLQEMGGRVMVLDLPEAKDPDEFLRSQGKEAFAAALSERTTGYLEFRLDQLLKRYNPENLMDRAEIARVLVDELANIQDHVVREGLIRMAAQRIHTSEEAIWLELSRKLRKDRLQKDKTEKNRYNMEQGKQTFEAQPLSAVEVARRGLFCFMCQDRRLYERVKQELGRDVFRGKYENYLKLFEKPGWEGAPDLLNRLPADEQQELAALLMSAEDNHLDNMQKERLIDDYIMTLKKGRLQEEIDEKQAALKEYEKMN
jgi:DNA primase